MEQLFHLPSRPCGVNDEAPPDQLRQVMRRDGELWVIGFAGRVCHVRDTIGMRCLAYLLPRPHEAIASLAIFEAVRAPGAGAGVADARAAERARINVTRALAAALRKLAPHHPELVQHLRATLRTGAACVYTPDPRLPSVWET